MLRRALKNPGPSVPIYQQLTEACRHALRDGTYRADERFPSERELASRYNISRVTANKVISNLVSEGLLIFRPGIGTFAAPATNLSASLREMESFTESAKALGLKPSTDRGRGAGHSRIQMDPRGLGAGPETAGPAGLVLRPARFPL
jgi:DNA-binding GntR family transcriptional regulator